ncbi:MAG: hypothetical protein M5U01_25120 [Ardenticatenaceae bacterium]|nr:hypothetical protein [Ardenticatenaceae bacterium]HBY97637.1 galactosyldiacylglycerol synthase [Chloroflexota bacterium]
MSDTGGGHRAAAEAIMRALEHLEPAGGVRTVMVDFFRETFLPPFNRSGATYRPMVNSIPWFWGFGFRATKPRPMRALMAGIEVLLGGRTMRHLFIHRNPDLVVSVHPLATSWPCRILNRTWPGVPFVTVVTDLATGHPSWFSRCTDWCFVPSEAARQNALEEGLRPERVVITGLPIDLRFATLPDPSAAAAIKAEYGAPPHKPLVLLVGGGEGMGNLEGYAGAIAEAGLDLALMVITGRNVALRQRLEQRQWPIPVIVTGFVRDMPRRMVAADAIVTKAGPGTLSEALAAGLPILVTGFIPGQEEGNVDWVVSSGAGRLTPDRASIQATLRDLFAGGRRTARHDAMATAARSLAHPNAALEVAGRLLGLLDGTW